MVKYQQRVKKKKNMKKTYSSSLSSKIEDKKQGISKEKIVMLIEV